MKGPGMGLCAPWADVEGRSGLRVRPGSDEALREAFAKEFAWLGPDRQQGIDSAMRAIEEWR